MNLQQVDSTLQELYFALNAVFRLDAASGNYFYSGEASVAGICSPQIATDPFLCVTDVNYPIAGLDGFFIRDDVYEGFRNIYGDPNADLTSSFFHPSGDCHEKELSQDQIIALSMGLYMVWKFCDVEYNGLHFADFARFELERIYEYCHSRNDWWLTNPHRNDSLIVRTNGMHMGHYSSPFTDVIQEVTGSAFGSPPGHPSVGTLSQQVMQDWQYYPWLFPPATDHMGLTMGVLSNQWFPGEVDRWGYKKYKEFFYLLQKIIHPNNHEATRLTPAYVKGILDDCPCEGPINTLGPAPDHYGWNTTNRFVTPCAEYGSGSIGLSWMANVFGWILLGNVDETLGESLTGHLVSDPPVVTDNFAEGQESWPYNNWFAEFPGIDYFNLFNAYTLTYGNPGDYFNLWDAHTWRDHPNDLTLFTPVPPFIPLVTLPVGAGSRFDPRIYRSLNSITADCKIHAGADFNYAGNDYSHNGKVTFIAANAIELLPGFEVEAGAEFEAFIDEIPIHCSGAEIFRTAAPGTSLAPAGSLSVGPVQAPAPFEGLNFTVHPNPGQDQITLRWQLAEGRGSLSLRDAQMRELTLPIPLKELNAGQGEMSWNAAHLSAGLYFFTLEAPEGRISLKWVKE